VIPLPETPKERWLMNSDDMAVVGGLSQGDVDALQDSANEPIKNDIEEIDLAGDADASPVVKLTNAIFVDALRRGASDIHIEPYETELRVRFRIDGLLYSVMALPMTLREPVASRIKAMARLALADERRSQRGRITIRFKRDERTNDVDYGVSAMPTLWGETIVMRLLGSRRLLDLTALGLEPSSLERLKRALAKPYGVVLIGGPTSSGRSSTGYAVLATLGRPDVNIMTAEDPVRFALPGVNQVDIRKGGSKTFAEALKDFLAQDPDIVFLDGFLGGISDDATASAGMSLALRGHVVLSTFNASDASSCVPRLTALGLDPELVATGVTLVLAQRLVRRICGVCRVDATVELSTETLVGIGFTPDEVGRFPVMKGSGCAACNGTGYKGRVGLFEVMEISEAIRALIAREAPAVEIRDKAVEEGMITLRRSGLEKIRQGMTTIEEVLRETPA